MREQSQCVSILFGRTKSTETQRNRNEFLIIDWALKFILQKDGNWNVIGIRVNTVICQPILLYLPLSYSYICSEKRSFLTEFVIITDASYKKAYSVARMSVYLLISTVKYIYLYLIFIYLSHMRLHYKAFPVQQIMICVRFLWWFAFDNKWIWM